MSDLDAVLERLVTDPAFAHELSRNPTTALARYELSEEDLSTLSTQVSFDRGAGSRVEDRISKAGMFGLLSTMAAGLSGLGGDAAGLGGPDTTPAGVGVENPTTIGDPNQAPGDERGYGLAVDAFHDGDEGPEELGGPDTAPAGIIILDEPHPGVIDPNQAPGDEFDFHDVEEGPEESVGIHEVDEQPAPDVAIHEVDQPAPEVGAADPSALVGFDPQPDPPGSRG